MLNLKKLSPSGNSGVMAALDQSLAIIELDTGGTIITANANFCKTMGYNLPEIRGQHHSLFVEPSYAQSHEYRDFWAKLGRGEHDAREYKRIAKGGREVWIQASYNPVRNARGKVVKVVKQATDVTAEKLRMAEFSAKLDAIGRAQAIIEFTVDGEVITANPNFLATVGYRLEEIKGQHHRLFIDPAYARSGEYEAFWNRLRQGEYVAAEFKRIAKGGREVWIQASYNPIFDLNGKVVKVVKFATDVTVRFQAVAAIATGLTQLSVGDLDRQIEPALSEAFEPLRLNFNSSVSSIRDTLSAVSTRIGAIRSGTSEIATASDDLSRRTEQQAASLEETAAALEEITATVRKTAEGSKHTREVVSTAKANAEASGALVRQAVDAIVKSNPRSAKRSSRCVSTSTARYRASGTR